MLLSKGGFEEKSPLLLNNFYLGLRLVFKSTNKKLTKHSHYEFKEAY